MSFVRVSESAKWCRCTFFIFKLQNVVEFVSRRIVNATYHTLQEVFAKSIFDLGQTTSFSEFPSHYLPPLSPLHDCAAHEF